MDPGLIEQKFSSGNRGDERRADPVERLLPSESSYTDSDTDSESLPDESRCLLGLRQAATDSECGSERSKGGDGLSNEASSVAFSSDSGDSLSDAGDELKVEEDTGEKPLTGESGSIEAERVPVGGNDDGPSSPVQIQVQVQIRSPDPPQDLDEENGNSEDFEKEGEEEYAEEEEEELNYTHPVKGDAASDATSPYVAMNQSEPTTPDANVDLVSGQAFLAHAGVDSGERSFAEMDVAPHEEIGDSSDLYSPEHEEIAPECDNRYGSMPASKSLENGVVSPALTAEDDFLASDNEGSDGPASSRASTNFNATRQHLHSTTSSIILPESNEGTPPRVQSFRKESSTPGRPTVPVLRLNNQHHPSSKGQVLSSSGASVDTTSGLHSTGDRSAGGTRLSGQGEVDPPIHVAQFGSARGPPRRRVFTPARTPRQEAPFVLPPFDGPSHQRPTVASESRRRAVEASKAEAAARNEGWGRHDYHNRPQVLVGPPVGDRRDPCRPDLQEGLHRIWGFVI